MSKAFYDVERRMGLSELAEKIVSDERYNHLMVARSLRFATTMRGSAPRGIRWEYGNYGITVSALNWLALPSSELHQSA
jgi:hypothetical protein